LTLRAFDRRGYLLLSASALLLSCLLKPHLSLPRPVFDWLIVVDITQSMNVRDYTLDHNAISRLEYAKKSIRAGLRELPCGSRVALGLFTERSTMNTMQPLEVCAHFGALDAAIAVMDWRMAWAADSFIAHGVFSAIDQTQKLGADMRLLFISDGQQAPPANAKYLPPFSGKTAAVRGWLVGSGNTLAVAIPKLDDENNIRAYWSLEDVQRYGTFGMAATMSVLAMEQGSQDRNAGHSAGANLLAAAHLSALDEPNLQRLAQTTGLDYMRLAQLQQLPQAMTANTMAVWRNADTDLRPLLALLAMLLLAAYFIPPATVLWLQKNITFKKIITLRKNQ
jgi:mxaL protein